MVLSCSHTYVICVPMGHVTSCLCSSQQYPVPSLGDEDFNIPPITPPTLPEHMLAHLPESESGTYHHLCPPVSQNGLHPFHLQGMDLQGMSVPNMLGQDGGLLTNSLSVVSIGAGADGSPFPTNYGIKFKISVRYKVTIMRNKVAIVWVKNRIVAYKLLYEL